MQGGGVMIDVDCFSHDTLGSSIATAAAAAAAGITNNHADTKSIRLKFRRMYRTSHSPLQTKFWDTLEDVIIEILVLVPSVLDDNHNKDHQTLLPLTPLKHIALLSASTQLTTITRILATALLDYSAKAANAKLNIRPAPLGTAIRQEANEIINQLQKVECLLKQEKTCTTTEQIQSINAALLSHAHNLVDALTAFSVSSAVAVIESSFSLDDFRPTPAGAAEGKGKSCDLVVSQHTTHDMKSGNRVGVSDKRPVQGISSLENQQIQFDSVPSHSPLKNTLASDMLECACRKENRDTRTIYIHRYHDRKPLPGAINISELQPVVSGSTPSLVREKNNTTTDSQIQQSPYRYTPSSPAGISPAQSSLSVSKSSSTQNFLPSPPPSAPLIFDFLLSSELFSPNGQASSGLVPTSKFEQKQYLTAPLRTTPPPPPPPQSARIVQATLKHYRSESDLARVRNISTSTSSSNTSAHALRVPLKTDHTPSATSRVIPQRTSSMHTRTLATSASTITSLEQNTSGASWNLLRSLRRNHSSINLKRHIEQETLRDTRTDLKTATSAPSVRAKCNGKHSTYQSSTIHVSEDGRDVLVMEMVSGEMRIAAGTPRKLFLELADERGQDLGYVDAYIMNHTCFTTSSALFENLAARFHLEIDINQIVHVKRCIQIKVLNVIARWIKIQYQDFKNNAVLLQRLEAFISGDISGAGFTSEAAIIRDTLDTQMARHNRRRHSLVALTCHSLGSFTVSSTSRPTVAPTTPLSSHSGSPPFRRQQQQLSSPPYSPSSMLSSFLSSTSSTPPASPTCLNFSSPPSHTQSILFAIDAKYIARYLTLADFYILKCITAYDYLHGHWRQRGKLGSLQDDQPCYIDMMAKRANTLTHWVVHELVSMKGPKQQRAGFRRILDIAKVCLEFNNFHTAMVLTMGLVASPVQKLHGIWDGLSKTDLNAFMGLQKYLDLGNNMGHYRHTFQKRTAKRASPSIPFFPLVLKDITFYMDGVSTTLPPSTFVSLQHQQQQEEEEEEEEPLINFGKFHDITKFVNQVMSCTREPYRFANELDHLAFFSPTRNGNNSMDPSFLSAGPLDQMAEVIEYRLRKVADCLSNNPSRCELFSGPTTTN